MAIYLSYLLSGQRAGVCALLLYIIGFHSHLYVTARSRWRYALSANHPIGHTGGSARGMRCGKVKIDRAPFLRRGGVLKGIVAVIVLMIGLSSALNFGISSEAPSAMEKRLHSSLEAMLIKAQSLPANNSTASLNRSNLDANTTMNQTTASGISSNETVSTTSVGSDVASSVSGNIRGFWSMEASKRTFGREGIWSRISLSGDFQVDKSVIFHEPAA